MNKLRNKATGAGLDAMLEMLPYVEEIINDSEFSDIKDKIKNSNDLTFGEMIKDTFPLIALKKRDAMYSIVSAVTGKSTQEIDLQPLCNTMEEFRDAMESDVLSFFIYSARLVARM